MSALGLTSCEICTTSLAATNPDVVRLARIKHGKYLCNDCYLLLNTGARERTCVSCQLRYYALSPRRGMCSACEVRDRTGADVCICPCGDTVPIEQSVRASIGNNIIRVCVPCSTSKCKLGKHTMVTPNLPSFDATRLTFKPVPPDLRMAYCSRCDQQFYWDGRTWTRMTWAVLAATWERV